MSDVASLKTLLFQLNKVSQDLRLEFNSHLQKHGLDLLLDQWLVLEQINKDESITPKELTLLTNKLAPSISRTIEFFKKRGLVTHSVDKSDRRSNVIRLTSKGAHLLNSVNEKISSHIVANKFHQFQANLDLLIKTLASIKDMGLENVQAPIPERIILIDDEVNVNIVNKKIIEKSKLAENVELIDFKSSREAVNYIIDHAAEISGRTIVLLDIRMPDLDGWGVMDRLREANVADKLSVFILSSSIDSRDIQKVEQMPDVIDFISKPLDISNLTGIFSSAKIIA